MDRKTAKEFLHLRDWLDRAGELIEVGREVYVDDALRQEAGDSLMMKIGEAANRLSRAEIAAPEGISWADAVANRNWLIHQYDEIDRELTWETLAKDLPAWQEALRGAFVAAEEYLEDETR